MTDQDMLHIAVVGHTNTGKTSLLRTLTHDVSFGQVDDAPGTTRQVHGARVLLKDRCVLILYDTPGIEDSMGLLDYLEQISPPGDRLDGPDRIRLFLQGPEASGRYEQEARVLAKLLDCQAGLYVIDARDPVLAKHKDELYILSSCGRPLLPILNFVASPGARSAEWRAALARLGLHTSVEFDSVSPPIDGEDTLYRTLSILLSAHQPLFLSLQQQAAELKVSRRAAAHTLIAGLLIDVAALRTTSRLGSEQLQQAVIAQQAVVRQREHAGVQALLALFQFRQDDYLAHPLPVTDGRWSIDLFHPQAIKSMGIHVGKGMAAGVVAGAAADVLSAGLSLGTGMLIGAVAGGALLGVERWGTRVLGRLRGYRELTVQDEILLLLWLRQSLLLDTLERRGHAAMGPVQLPGQVDDAIRVRKLPKQLEAARAHPEWSSVGDQFCDSHARQQAIAVLAHTAFIQG